MNSELIRELKESFNEIYGIEAEDVYFAPGRVNLIGEHIDYNGGHVMPCALSLGTYGIINRRDDSVLRMYSLNFSDDGIREIQVSELYPGRTDKWTQYPEGIIWTMKEQGYNIEHGADIMFAGDVPAGSGLSSSASIEVLTAMMIRDTFGLDGMHQMELALVGQRSENVYNGVQCGIMDQFASAMGKKDCAIFLNTDTMDYSLIPLKLGDYKIIIVNTNVKHSLAGSEYNDRRTECENAVKAMKSGDGCEHIDRLCRLTAEEFDKLKIRIEDPVCLRRATHAVMENMRTVQAAEALWNNNLEEFGRLMNASHVSLRDDYQVSCDELDFLAEEAWKTDGVIGSRMTGGGFGGCTVNIVRKDKVNGFIESLRRKYEDRFGIKPSFYQATPEEGAHRLDKQEY